MKKIVLSISIMIIAIVAGCTLQLGASNTLKEGNLTPGLIVENKDSVIDLRSLGGKYVLIDFWSSADGPSRLKSKEYAAFSDGSSDRLERVSVNFDRSERLFQEIVSRDGLDSSSQFYAQGQQARRIKRDFGLNDGYKSFLIDPVGRIIAVNPDIESVSRLIAQAI